MPANDARYDVAGKTRICLQVLLTQSLSTWRVKSAHRERLVVASTSCRCAAGLPLKKLDMIRQPSSPLMTGVQDDLEVDVLHVLVVIGVEDPRLSTPKPNGTGDSR